MNQSVLISKVKGSYNRSSILLLSWTFEVWYLHWLDHASLGSHIDFERLMNLSRVKPAILSSKWVLVVKPRTDQISDLYSYMLSDRTYIWYRDQFVMLSRIVPNGYLLHFINIQPSKTFLGRCTLIRTDTFKTYIWKDRYLIGQKEVKTEQW